ncbi:thioesterase II family protein [Streptomyces albidoflavus]
MADRIADWIAEWPLAGTPASAPALVCVPPAGAGCQRFRSWQERLGARAAVYGVQLPGRENRWHDAMPATFDEAVDAATAALTARLAPGRPLVVYGHSFGGLLAYELARRTAPHALVVSGARAPGRAGRRTGGTAGQDPLDRLFDADDPDLDPVQAAGLRDPWMRELMRDMVRKDAALSRTHVHRPDPPLRIPVHVWGADADTAVAPRELDGWAGTTEGPLHRRRIPGGHHTILRRPEVLLDHLADLLAEAAGAAPASAARPDAVLPGGGA